MSTLLYDEKKVPSKTKNKVVLSFNWGCYLQVWVLDLIFNYPHHPVRTHHLNACWARNKGPAGGSGALTEQVPIVKR
jgi:hypothetical protein